MSEPLRIEKGILVNGNPNENYKCVYCGEMGSTHIWKCTDCGQVFDGELKPAGEPQCVCQSQMVAAHCRTAQPKLFFPNMTERVRKAFADSGMTEAEIDEEMARIEEAMQQELSQPLHAPVGGTLVPQNKVEHAAARTAIGAKLEPHYGPMPEKFETVMVFDEVELAPGETKTVDGRVEDRVALFRGERVTAVESVSCSTRVLALTVATPSKGERPQMPQIAGGVLTTAFNNREVLYDTHDPAKGPVRFTVNNISDQPVKWSAKIEGKAIGR